MDREVERRELLRGAAEAVHALPPPYRAAFRLFLEQHSHAEIGRALGISAAGAAKRVGRARKQLYLRLAPLLGAAADGAVAGRGPDARSRNAREFIPGPTIRP